MTLSLAQPNEGHEDAPELDRSRLRAVQAIAQTILSQQCVEEGVKLRRLIELDLGECKTYIEAAAFILAWTLDEDRRETAIMCMADVICADGETRGIDDYPKSVQQRYYRLCVAGLHALTENMKDVPPDYHHRDRMCRLLDGLFPKPQQPAKKAVWG